MPSRPCITASSRVPPSTWNAEGPRIVLEVERVVVVVGMVAVVVDSAEDPEGEEEEVASNSKEGRITMTVNRIALEVR